MSPQSKGGKARAEHLTAASRSAIASAAAAARWRKAKDAPEAEPFRLTHTPTQHRIYATTKDASDWHDQVFGVGYYTNPRKGMWLIWQKPAKGARGSDERFESAMQARSHLATLTRRFIEKAAAKVIPDDEVWTMKNGTVITVGDMDEDHAKNALRMMIRRARSPRVQALHNLGFALRSYLSEAGLDVPSILKRQRARDENDFYLDGTNS